MEPGDRIRVTNNGEPVEGILLPSSTDDHLVVKRDGGYNIGIDRESASVAILEHNTVDMVVTEPATGAASTVVSDDSLPTISLLSTGGTIASTVDYRTGAVSPRFDVEDVLTAVPELEGRANYRGRVISNILSENMRPAIWQSLAEAIAEEIAAGADGVVVMHGTDTMQFSASAIAFMIDSPIPIVFTGSQRSADRPSSDNVVNAVCAVEAATSDIAEVIICMHAGGSDDRCALHRGTRARKNHTSRRSAFETVGQPPLGTVTYPEGDVSFRPGAIRHTRGDQTLSLTTDLNTDVALLKFVPGADANQVEACTNRAGLVIEGTGLGHVNDEWLAAIESLPSDVPVVITSQCLEGRVCDRVYETGRDMLEAGVIEAEDTLPETAYVKLMWAIENVEDVPATMKESLAGELTDSSRPWS